MYNIPTCSHATNTKCEYEYDGRHINDITNYIVTLLFFDVHLHLCNIDGRSYTAASNKIKAEMVLTIMVFRTAFLSLYLLLFFGLIKLFPFFFTIRIQTALTNGFQYNGTQWLNDSTHMALAKIIFQLEHFLCRLFIEPMAIKRLICLKKQTSILLVILHSKNIHYNISCPLTVRKILTCFSNIFISKKI